MNWHVGVNDVREVRAHLLTAAVLSALEDHLFAAEIDLVSDSELDGVAFLGGVTPEHGE